MLLFVGFFQFESSFIHRNNKHLMTDPKGNSEFCFPETLHVEVEGKQVRRVAGPVIKCFVIPPDSKLEKILDRNRLLTNMPRCQGPRPDNVRVESSCCCFSRELVSFVRPRELHVHVVSFEPRHVTRSPPIRKRG